MADYTLSASITADSSKFQKSMKKAADAMDALSAKCTGLGDVLGSIGGKMSSAGAKLTALEAAVAGVAAAAGKNIVETGASFEDAMANVSAVSGSTGTELQKLSDKAKEMGAKTKFSASEAADAMKYMAMAGWKTEDMLNGIEGIMNLAAASGEDLATTSDIVTDALTAFGLSAADSAEFADVLAAASSNANTNVAMMGETFKYVAPVAGALGYSTQDTAIAIGLMANAGIKSSQAGTALRSVLSRLAKPTEEVQGAMDELGLSLTDGSGNMKSFRQVMEDLRRGFSGMTKDQQAAMAATLGGQEAMSGLLAIVNASDSDFEKLSDAIDHSTGACQDMADTMNATLSGQFTILKSQIEGIQINIFEQMEPGLMNLVKSAQKAADAVSQLIQVFFQAKNALGNFAGLEAAINKLDSLAKSGAVPGYFSEIAAKMQLVMDKVQSLKDAGVPLEKIAAATLAAGPALIAVGKAVSMLGGLSKVLGGVVGGVGKIAGAFLAIPAPILAVVAVVAALAAGFAYLYKTDSGAALQMQAAWGNIQNAVSSAVSAILPALQELGSVLLDAGSTILPAILGVVKALIPVVTSAVSSTVSVLSAVIPAITNILNTLIPIITGIVTQAAAVLEQILPVITQVIQAAVPLINQAVGTVSDILVQILPVVQQLISALLPMIGDVAGMIGNAFVTILPAVQQILSAVSPLISKLISVVSDVIPVILEVASAIVSAVIPAVTTLVQNLMPAMVQVIQSLVPAISSVLSAVLPVIQQILPVILSLIQQLLPVFTQIITLIGNFVASLAPVIAQLIDQLVPVITNIVSIISNLITTLMPAITAAIQVVMSIVNAIMAAIEALMPVITTIITVVTNVISTVISILSPIISFVAGIMNAIMAVITPIVTFVADIIAGVVDVISVIIDVIAKINAFIGGVLSDIWSAVSGVASKVGDAVSKTINTASSIISGLSAVVSKIFNSIYSTIKSVMDKVKNTFSTVFDKIQGLWDGLKDFVGGIFDGISSALDNLISGVKGMANTFIDGINFAIEIINNIPGVSIGPLDHLAHGTDDWQGGFARMNEGGRGELVSLPSGTQVIPHDISKQYAKEAARMNSNGCIVTIDYAAIGAAVAAAMAGVDIHTTVDLDGKTVADAVTPYVDQNLGRRAVMAKRYAQ